VRRLRSQRQVARNRVSSLDCPSAFRSSSLVRERLR
jgi:hypothetical protein